jgi:hypothetical protein
MQFPWCVRAMIPIGAKRLKILFNPNGDSQGTSRITRAPLGAA